MTEEEQEMPDEETVLATMESIRTQMRTLGVYFQDDLGRKLSPGGSSEQRIIQIMARHVAQVAVSKSECQTSVRKSES